MLVVPKLDEYFSAEHFEDYYPTVFKQTAWEVLAMPHGLAKQKAKGELADAVVNWELANSETAKAEFRVCAKEILDLLAEISKKLS